MEIIILIILALNMYLDHISQKITTQNQKWIGDKLDKLIELQTQKHKIEIQ